ncbi:hypothetical protein GQX62_01805 [Brachyspira hyodysenteriae]|uniref:YidC/Oxa1 family membrane protein insertase n=1 Tax=Brachyspira hyodysenteriae TaxID=159 RepID=UPI001ADD6299|nr:YidC/Oxa1 family membrane protein insertase [Brachyspira hyodysenteriae]QTM02418.1 hypothetical protein GQX62_01805 [Brachyspira hyodysenteriae]QTM04981.1 hypothetical protein GQX61_01780 [Brachyspira hyodysenteriae]
MIFFDIFYNIIIYPIEFIIEILFYLFSVEFKSSYGVSLFLLSLCINFLSLPLYNIAESWQAKERAIQDKMKPMIDNIKAVYKGDQRYLLIRTCQRINGYKTIYAFRGTLGLLIQIPFFMAAYNFVHSLTGLSGQSFLFIKDLSKPDALIHIGNISINLLPFLMTLFSLLAGFVYSRKLKFKESLPLYVVSLIFLLLLYNSPSGLLFYWTINCLFSFIKNIIIEFKLYEIFVRNRYKLLKAYNIFFIIITVLLISLISLGNIERKCYLTDFKLIDGYTYNISLGYYSKVFRNSDIYGVLVNNNKLDSNVIDITFEYRGSRYGTVKLKDRIENIGTINLYYKLFIKQTFISYYVLLLILLIFFNLKRINNIFNLNVFLVEKSFIKNRKYLILLSCLVISLLSGLFIPSSLIGNSPQEFRSPFNLIFNDLSMSLGLFLFYPLFIYILFSDKIKNIMTIIFVCLASIVLINTFIMVGNYININADFIFDNTDLLKASSNQIILNLFLILLIISIFLFLMIKRKFIFIMNIYIIIIIALVSVSIFDIKNIIIGQNELKKISAYNNDNIDTSKIFNLSKNGENIFVLILDRAIPSHWLDLLERFPEYKAKLDGFVIYPNTVSLGLNTSSSMSSIYGGYNYSAYNLKKKDLFDGFTSPKGITSNGVDVNNEAILTIPLALEKYGYKTSILEPLFINGNYDMVNTTIFSNYQNVSAYANSSFEDNAIKDYIGNVNSKNDNTSKYLTIRFSIFRMLPINLRHSFYSDKNWFMNNNRINSSIYTYAIMSYLKKNINVTDEKERYYNLLHNMITHETGAYNSNFLPNFRTTDVNSDDLKNYKNDFSVRHFYCNGAALNLIIELLDFLKNNNVYDNTKIIVASDHGWFVNTSSSTNLFVNWYNSLLMVKDFNSRGEIEINNSFMTSGDIAYLTVNHIPNIKDYFNNELITNNYKNNGIYMMALPWKGNNMKFYRVKDNIFDINNWSKFEMQKDKSMKEIPLEFDERMWE